MLLNPGYQVETGMRKETGEMHQLLKKCTTTFVGKVKGKSVRVRFLPKNLISDQNNQTIEEYLISFYHVYSLAQKEEQKKVEALSQAFLDMIDISNMNYNRYRYITTSPSYYFAKLSSNFSCS